MAENSKGLAYDRTLVLVKPDGVQRGLIGEVISRLEQRGLKILALKMVKPSIEHLDKHYPQDEAWITRLGEKGFKTFAQYGIDPKEHMGTDSTAEAGKMVRKWLVDYLSEAPVVAMIIGGVHALDVVRKIAGETIPLNAAIGTVRGDFSNDSPAAANLEKRAIKNVMHASENKEEAEHEIAHWFSEEEIYDYELSAHTVMFK